MSTAASPSLRTASGQLVPLAGWWRRGRGYFLDALLLAALYYGAAIVLGSTIYSRPFAFIPINHASPAAPGWQIALSLSDAVVGILYAVWLIGLRGQTVGMKAVGVRAVDTSGSPLAGEQVWKRAIGFFLLVGFWSRFAFVINAVEHRTTPLGTILGMVSFAMYLTTFLWATRSPSNQTLQDKIARSVVIVAA